MRRMPPSLKLGLLAAAAVLAGAVTAAPAAAASTRVHAVTIDPADYLSAVPDASALARQLVERFAANGVDRIYVNAYNVEYGAYYRTTYRYDQESEYGRQDLLGKLLAAAHARGIQVVAAFYDHQHRGAWEARPGWREKTPRGGDYNPPVTDIQYYLSTGNPQAAAWWRGFLLDVLRRYPALDGVELREPIVNWWGVEADYNPAVTRAFRAAHPRARLGDETWRRFRSATLTRFLQREIALVHARGRFAEVTTVADAYGEGKLVAAESEARETGFDLGALLRGPQRPDAVKVELIWQQWARLYGRIAFTPEWTGDAAAAFVRRVRGRAPVIVHVELTDFGRSSISADEFFRTLRAAASVRGLRGVDFYSAYLADAKRAWPAVRAVYGGSARARAAPGLARDRRVLVLYDAGGTGERAALAKLQQTELLNLLGHFPVKWESHPMRAYRRGDLAGYSAVVYLGSVYGSVSQQFLSDVSVFDGSIVWIGANLWQLERSGVRLPFAQPSQRLRTGSTSIRYRGVELPAKGEAIATRARAGAHVVATLGGGGSRMPFVLRAGRFWYVTGSPFTFLEIPPRLNGRYLVFADALHDMLGIRAAAGGRRALVRVEDVNPLTDPAHVRVVAATLARRHVPFSISVTPFYVDPKRGVDVSLSERPSLVAALREAVARGGAIVLHGSTHQYRGRTGVDAEFWDLRNRGGLPVDSDAYVRARVLRGLEELWRNGLHPVAWETPHYLATAFDYSLFLDFFSTFLERRTYGVWNGTAYQQPLPFEVGADVYGARIVPENLGYVVHGSVNVEPLLVNARELRVVRDAVAGAYVHVGTNPALVGRLVRGLRRLGYRFLDVYTLPNVVEGPDRVELTGSGSASLPVPSGWELRLTVLDRAGDVTRKTEQRFASYARPVRTFAPVPGGGLASLVVLPSGAPDLGVPGSGGHGVGVVTALFYVALAALALLLLAYAGVKTVGRRAVRS
jgi:Uncharacterized protein conserved in bacteria (DUF2334)